LIHVLAPRRQFAVAGDDQLGKPQVGMMKRGRGGCHRLPDNRVILARSQRSIFNSAWKASRIARSINATLHLVR
jgi:hypothetical protein